MGHSGDVIARKDNLVVINCLQCGWAHLNPLPDANEIERHYKENYYTSSEWFEKEWAEHAGGLWDTAYRFQSGLLDNEDVIDWG